MDAGAEVTEARVQQTQQRLLQLTKSSATSNHTNLVGSTSLISLVVLEN